MTEEGRLVIGFDALPQPIIDGLQRRVHERPDLPQVYHISELVYGLKKAFYRRKFPELDSFSLDSLLSIFRGQLFDGALTPLFQVNQRSYVVHRGNVTITGTFDFLWQDDEGTLTLFDLKMPKSVYYKRLKGATQGNVRQVQSYLAMAHANGELLDVHQCGVLMIAEYPVQQFVTEDDAILPWLWNRAFALDHALTVGSPKALSCPEEKWECDAKYCAYTKICKQEEM